MSIFEEFQTAIQDVTGTNEYVGNEYDRDAFNATVVNAQGLYNNTNKENQHNNSGAAAQGGRGSSSSSSSQGSSFRGYGLSGYSGRVNVSNTPKSFQRDYQRWENKMETTRKELEKSLEETTQKLETIRQEIQEIEEIVAEQTEQIEEIKQAEIKLENEIEEAKTQVETIEKTIAEDQETKANIKKEQEFLGQEIDQGNEEIAKDQEKLDQAKTELDEAKDNLMTTRDGEPVIQVGNTIIGTPDLRTINGEKLPPSDYVKCCAAMALGNGTTADEVEQLQEHVDSLESNIQATQERVHSLVEKFNLNEEQLAVIDKSIEYNMTQKHEYNNLINQQNKQLEDLREQREALELDRDNNQEKISELREQEAMVMNEQTLTQEKIVNLDNYVGSIRGKVQEALNDPEKLQQIQNEGLNFQDLYSETSEDYRTEFSTSTGYELWETKAFEESPLTLTPTQALETEGPEISNNSNEPSTSFTKTLDGETADGTTAQNAFAEAASNTNTPETPSIESQPSTPAPEEIRPTAPSAAGAGMSI